MYNRKIKNKLNLFLLESGSSPVLFNCVLERVVIEWFKKLNS